MSYHIPRPLQQLSFRIILNLLLVKFCGSPDPSPNLLSKLSFLNDNDNELGLRDPSGCWVSSGKTYIQCFQRASHARARLERTSMARTVSVSCGNSNQSTSSIPSTCIITKYGDGYHSVTSHSSPLRL